MDDDSSLAAQGAAVRSGKLTATEYAEVRRLFFEAVALSAEERCAFVEQVAAVSPLGMELKQLLAEHRDDPAAASSLNRIQSSASRTSRTKGSSRRSLAYLWCGLGFLFSIITGLTFYYDYLSARGEAEQLTTTIQAIHAAQCEDVLATINATKAFGTEHFKELGFVQMMGALQRQYEEDALAGTFSSALKIQQHAVRKAFQVSGIEHYAFFNSNIELIACSDETLETRRDALSSQGTERLRHFLEKEKNAADWFSYQDLNERRFFPHETNLAVLHRIPGKHPGDPPGIAMFVPARLEQALLRRFEHSSIPDFYQASLTFNEPQASSLSKHGLRSLFSLVASQSPVGLATPIPGTSATVQSKINPQRFPMFPRFSTAGLCFLPGFLAALCFAQARRHSVQIKKTADGQIRVGHYLLESVIGYGGMGIVYRARHEHLQRPFAVKMMDPNLATPALMERFEREVHLTAKLNHPNTIAIFDFGRTPEGGLFYVMEFLNGMPLSELVRQQGALPPARVAYLLKQVCASLTEAHRHGLLHRDIKPANVMACCLGGEGDVVKVLDFGLVKDLSRPSSTTVSTLAGTPRYMAPERIWDAHTTDARVDIYAVGAVAYMLLTGRELFAEVTDGSLIYSVVNHLPPPPSQLSNHSIPKALDDLILSCLAKNPEERPRTIQDVYHRLDTIEFAEAWDHTAARLAWEQNDQSAVTETVQMSTSKTDTVVLAKKSPTPQQS